MSIGFKCAICEANFPKPSLNENGICKICEIENPGAKTKEEAQKKIKPDLVLTTRVNEERAREIALEVYNEMENKKKMEKARSAKKNKGSN